MRAMILAAGLGRRMAPLSDRRAKPSLPVLDTPIARHLLDRLAAAGVERVVVNAHAHADSLREALRDPPIPVELSLEAELLGSAGGIREARGWLEGPEPFLVVNGDMLLDLDLPALVAQHRRGGAIATLALRDDPRGREFGTIGYDAEGRVCRITDRISCGAENGSGLFIGVQILESQVFSRMPDRRPLWVRDDVYVPMLQRGESITTWQQPQEAAWWPIGQPRELLEANWLALEREVGRDGVRVDPAARLDGRVHPPAWVGAGAHVPAGAEVGPWTVVGRGAQVPDDSAWRRALLLPAARPMDQGCVTDAIAYGEEVWRDA